MRQLRQNANKSVIHLCWCIFYEVDCSKIQGRKTKVKKMHSTTKMQGFESKNGKVDILLNISFPHLFVVVMWKTTCIFIFGKE